MTMSTNDGGSVSEKVCEICGLITRDWLEVGGKMVCDTCKPLVTISADTTTEGHDPGMSLRDWFAGQALAQLESFFIADRAAIREGDAPHIAGMCYQIADAMLAERNRDDTD